MAITTDIVITAETNHYNNMFGGEILARLDKAGYICAARHCESEVVTASVNHVAFPEPIPIGSMVTLKSFVTRSFNTSLEVIIEVWCEYRGNFNMKKLSEAIFTYVAIDNNGKPKKTPALKPETEEEKKRFNAALRRRQLNLILAKRIKPDSATELKKLFVN